jgi:hypothetical protein
MQIKGQANGMTLLWHDQQVVIDCMCMLSAKQQ